MSTSLKLFLQGIRSVLDIYPTESKNYKRLIKKINDNKSKTDAELLASDWEEIGEDFNKIIGR